jgi:thymidylate synthase (FAD)
MTKQEQVVNDERYITLYEHGFVGILDTMGSDQDICDAARVSYGSGTKSVNDDRNLLRYLMRHWHTSPLEMGEVKFHLKLPIFIMRQLVRHRTANLNEYSGRYSEMSDEFYVPSDEYMAPQSTTNKQGRAGVISVPQKKTIRTFITAALKTSYDTYRRLLGEVVGFSVAAAEEEYPGLSRELARIVLPVSNYTECYWKCDLHNFFHFARLRMDSHAQQEIRDYATAMYELTKPYFPLACEAFEDYRMNARSLSRMDTAAIKDMLAGTFVPNHEHYGMSKREYTELVDFLGVSKTPSVNV